MKPWIVALLSVAFIAPAASAQIASGINVGNGGSVNIGTGGATVIGTGYPYGNGSSFTYSTTSHRPENRSGSSMGLPNIGGGLLIANCGSRFSRIMSADRINAKHESDRHAEIMLR